MCLLQVLEADMNLAAKMSVKFDSKQQRLHGGMRIAKLQLKRQSGLADIDQDMVDIFTGVIREIMMVRVAI